MCKYCDNWKLNKTGKVLEGCTVTTIYNYNNKPCMNVQADDPYVWAGLEDINYCPFCGKKLV